MSEAEVGPHGFRSLGLGDWRQRGRCAYCYCARYKHPIEGWVPARPIGDRSRAKIDETRWRSDGEAVPRLFTEAEVRAVMRGMSDGTVDPRDLDIDDVIAEGGVS